ncbi:MAG: serine hydrolase [Bacteroidetes bacterium]|nr:serine hydrolase [Bacteroidota bacterium]
MRPTFFLLLAGFFYSLNLFSQTEKLPPGFDGYVQNVLAQFNVPGCAVAVVKDGKTILAKGYGSRQVGKPANVDGHTLFCIASNSKAFTAAALAILVEEGKLNWDDPVVRWLPWFRMSDDYVSMHLTVKDLLVHHSGLAAYTGDLLYFPPSDFTRRQVLWKLRDMPLVHGFRTTYAYDNILYLAAGEIIETVSHMRWEDFVRTRIFDKIGMTDTRASVADLDPAGNIAYAHVQLGDKVVQVDDMFNRLLGRISNPAGGIASSANDMAKWMITQLDSGKLAGNQRLFSAKTTKNLWSMVQPIPVSKLDPPFAPAQMDFYGYALGFRTYNYRHLKVVGHGGRLDGTVSQVAMIPSLGLGITVLTNQDVSSAYWPIIYSLIDYYAGAKKFDWLGSFKTAYDKSLKEGANKADSMAPVNSLAKDSIPFSRYVGVYRDAVYGDISIALENNQPTLRFIHSPLMVADLQYYRYQHYVARFRHRDLRTDAYVKLNLNETGAVEDITMRVFDPASDNDFSMLRFKPLKKMDTASLYKSIREVMAMHPEATFGIAFKDLQTGEEFGLGSNQVFHAASTMKTAVLIETFRQIKEGRFKLSDSILVKNEFSSIVDGSAYSLAATDDSEFDLYAQVGKKLPIADILHRMITLSSNMATNLIIELVGAENVMKTIGNMGLKDMKVLRGVEDNKAYRQGLNNVTTAHDLVILMEWIAKGKAVDRASSDQMIAILKDQQFKDVIAGLLPKEVEVASKSGSITKVQHDSGIVFLPNGQQYTIALLSSGIAGEAEAKATLAKISKIIYDHIINQ